MKKILKLSIVISLITLMLAFMPNADSYAATKNAKKEVTYKLKDGILTIKGKGDMPKSMNIKKNKKIKEVVIKKGVTSISYKAFYKCKNLKKVKIPNTVKKIGALSFLQTDIEKITIPTRAYVGQRTYGEDANSENYTMTRLKDVFGEEAIYSLQTGHVPALKVSFTLDEDGNNRSDLLEWMFAQSKDEQ